MDISPILEALGVNGLADITLKELQVKINNIQRGILILPRQQVLQVFMGWLHERIIRDIQQKSLLSEFIDLLLVPGKLHQMSFIESEVDAAFKGWQAKDAAENPANIRRYQMVHLDFLELFEQAKRNSSSEPDWSFGPSGFDRERDSSASPDDQITRLVGGGKRKSGSNTVPLGDRKRFRSTIPQKTTKAEEEIKEENEKGGSTPVKLENCPQKLPSHTKSSLLDSSPPPLYVCNRCHKPGHWIQLCPTNLDPKWDRPPPSNYTCEICQKKGHHYATLCPQNKKGQSLTKQRQNQEDRPRRRLKTPKREAKTRGRDNYRLTPPFGHRSRSPRDNYPHQASDVYGSDDHLRFGGSDRDSNGRFRDRSSSPYTTRRRVAFVENYDHEQGSGNRRHEPTQTSSPALPYRGSKAAHLQRNPRASLELGKTQKGEIGRLSYNDVFVGPSLSPKEYAFSHKPKRIDTRESENEVMTYGSMGAEDTPDETERAKAEADKFLEELDTDPHGQKSRSGLDIMSFLKSHDNPIIHRKASRKTAVEMFDEVYKPQTEQ
ncbi:uncharacterized protein F4807DRAFT_459271 [Annulohypoxylon truncatum]|uniref:uncharacterized protein n=1 Tax=Annulohypoxylon truncatum TaxID=327061 RepID=UPI0020085EFE|nr:uncharacterized protein F4807DRAFT_459271 [Annulohypoxylon truncatum]KAI1211041.1 hypothetical protein F4807DRAFT_459271 [Annulohypoxylon truncatum]